MNIHAVARKVANLGFTVADCQIVLGAQNIHQRVGETCIISVKDTDLSGARTFATQLWREAVYRDEDRVWTCCQLRLRRVVGTITQIEPAIAFCGD